MGTALSSHTDTDMEGQTTALEEQSDRRKNERKAEANIKERRHSDTEETSSQTEAIRREMHAAIDKKYHVEVSNCLERAQHLKLWLHPDREESALHRAIQNNAFYIYGLLRYHKCDLKDEDEKRCFDELNVIQKSELQRQRFFETEGRESYINFLKSRTVSQAMLEGFDRKVHEILMQLDRIDLIRPTLQVAATSPHLRIRFDCEKDDVQCMTGCSGRSNEGLTDMETEEIFIGASTLKSAEEDQSVLGTLAHELCHLALYLVYRNGGKPYRTTDVESKRIYHQVIKDAQQRRKKLDYLISRGLDYDQEEELIVRVPHILAERGSPGHGDDILQSQTPELLEFYIEFVVPDMMTYLKHVSPGKDAEIIREENALLGKAHGTDKLNVSFEDPLLQDVPLLILTAVELTLLEIIVHEAVKSTGQPYLFFDVSQWADRLSSVLLVRKCNIVLLSYDAKEKAKDAFEFLSEVSKVVGTRIILLVQKEKKEQCVEEVVKNAFFADHHLVERVDKARFENVAQKCKNDVLSQSYMRFQGKDYMVKVSDVLDTEGFLTSINTSMFLKLCESSVMDMGPPLSEPEGDINKYYIERKLKGIYKCHKEELVQWSPDKVFAFYGCSEDIVNRFLPRPHTVEIWYLANGFDSFVFLEDIDDFENMIENYPYRDKTVKLLEYDKSEEGSSSMRRKDCKNHFPFKVVVFFDEEEFLDRIDRVVVVCGEPGLGKSVLSCRLSKHLKEKDNKKWVIHIHLPERIECVHGETDAKNLQQLAMLCGVQTDGTEFFLFQQCVSSGVPFDVVIIFDSFDEISEKGRDYILNVVSSLKQTKVSKIYIFSRTVFRTQIEDRLIHDAVFELTPFSDNQLDEFVEKYWKAKGLTHISGPELRSAAKKTVDTYRRAMKGNEAVLRNPLVIRMIAETEGSANVEEATGQHTPRRRRMFDIYRNFANYKSNVYLVEKLRLESHTFRASREYERARIKDDFFYKLGLLATSVIFHDIKRDILRADELEAHERLTKEVAEGDLGYGIADGVIGGVILRFIHKTFAEFFAADFLFRRIKQNPGLTISVLKMYESDEYEQVMLFLDDFAAASSELHSAIVRRDKACLLLITRENMYHPDEFGRTPLHIAALLEDTDVIDKYPVSESLLRKDMFGMTPLMYADKRGKYRALNKLCSLLSEAEIDWAKELPTVFDNLMKEKNLPKSVLGRAVRRDLCSLLRVLLNQFCRKRSEHHRYINSHRVDVDSIRGSVNETVLFHVKSRAAIELLLPYCDGQAVEEYGHTPLQNISCLHPRLSLRDTGFYEKAELFLLYLQVDVPNCVQYTPLLMCAQNGKHELVKLLLLRSRTNVKDKWGRTPLQVAVEEKRPGIINLLLPHSSLYPFEKRSQFDLSMSLKKLGWMFDNATGTETLVSLHYSSEKLCRIASDVKEEETLLDAFKALFPYVNIYYESNWLAKCIVLNAFEGETYKAVLKLSLFRFDATSRNIFGGTALHTCATIDFPRGVQLLLPHSDIRSKNAKGMIALEVAHEHHGEGSDVANLLRSWAVNDVFCLDFI